MLALGRLDSVRILLPDVSIFLYTHVRKEAVLSSMIEGTRSSLSDLLLYELDEQAGVETNSLGPFDAARTGSAVPVQEMPPLFLPLRNG